MLSTTLTRSLRASSSRALATAAEAFERSCYLGKDYYISEHESVNKAIEKLVAYDFGCLVTVNEKGGISGVVSERDVIQKWAVYESPLSEVMVSDICTQDPIVAMEDDSVEECMAKMMNHDIRHLPLVSTKGDLKGMISIKDCVKMVVKEKEDTIQSLSNFAVGKSGHFVVD